MAIDTKLRDYLKEKGVNCYYKDIQVCHGSQRCLGLAVARSNGDCIFVWCGTAHGDNGSMPPLQITESQKKTGSNHAISALKFKIIHEFLDLGYSVVLSDIDIVWLDVSLQHILLYWILVC